MRLWSLHPRHLDSRGLVALWREGLLARAVLKGLTRGYRNHPQLLRFKACASPVYALDGYLSGILDEARGRGYQFNARKIKYRPCGRKLLSVTSGQLAYEWKHLLKKLARRSPIRWRAERRHRPAGHPCFRVKPGGIAPWEKSGNLVKK
jgi:hypothetical protein